MKWISLLLFFIMVTAARAWSAVEAAVPVRVEKALDWDNKRQSPLVMALARDAQNTIWAATEGGIYRYRPQVEVGPKWLAYRASEGLIVEDQVYALAVDNQQRVWAGLARGGVGVCNSDFWTAYGRLAGPLGEHVTAIAPDPNGDVWIGSDGGLCVYRARDHKWRYFTRAEGLPSDQISAIAFSPGGNVVVGTLCHGLAIGSRADDFKSWRTVEGPNRTAIE